MTKKSKETLFFGIFAFVVACFLFIAPYFLIPQIYATRNSWIYNAPKDACFLELWEIDTFEGGSASRARFLEKTAFLYQQKTGSVYVIVRSINLTQAQNMIANGTTPDLISFGLGGGDLVAGLARNIEANVNVRADLLAGGRHEGQNLAVPWCMGGYLLCSKAQNQDFGVNALQTLADKSERGVIGTGCAYNVPAKALTDDYSQFLVRNKLSQYEAYEAFLRGNEFEILLGTQRDFFRLNNKVNVGALSNISYQYLSTYTDLVQYLSITTTNENLVPVANEFIKYVTSSENQKKLTSIGMFCVTGEMIYSDNYKEFEKALSGKIQVMNVFVSNVWLKEEQEK